MNGQAVTAQENPQDLVVNLNGDTTSGYSLSIDLAVQQSDNPLLNTQSSITLTKTNQ